MNILIYHNKIETKKNQENNINLNLVTEEKVMP